MVFILVTFICSHVLILALRNIFAKLRSLLKRLQGRARKHSDPDIFYGDFLEVKAFYLKEFKKVPCISYIHNIDISAVFEFLQHGSAGEVLTIYQRTYFNWQTGRQELSRTVVKLKGSIMIELSENYAELLFANGNFASAQNLLEAISAFKAPEREHVYEINIITLTASGLDFKRLSIKPQAIDLDLYYNDDFLAVDELVRQRLSCENDKGIVLLHGQPGTGKTTYLRHVIGSVKKKILFVSPSVAGNLMNPEFIDLLIDNPNSVLVIEDAENIIMDRKYSSNSSVSNLLNISDGLLSDCLNVQIICTFNSALNMIDTALLRKGRLIAKYEFGKLEIAKAQRLSEHLGLTHRITKPMTLAEITNPDGQEVESSRNSAIGFKRVEQLIEN